MNRAGLGLLDLGAGIVGRFKAVDGAAIPYGISILHARGSHAGAHRVEVLWARPAGRQDAPIWDLDSLYPLTLQQTIRCPRCGLRGRITEDQWLRSRDEEGHR